MKSIRRSGTEPSITRSDGGWIACRWVACAAALSFSIGVMAKPPTVAVAQGKVSGLVRPGVIEYRNIPYAAPPVGPLRWRPPEAPAAWTGVRDGTKFAEGCPAIDTLGVFGARSEAENCLFLNVTSPATAKKDKLPVLIWIPGGAFFNGSAADYDASALAKRGVVVVTINYRVGALGFFAHPAIDGEGHPFGNYGLMDQQAAMRWVRDNIGRFGGDPGNVTLSGESAGGISAVYQLVSPGARGLFHKAINQSGSRTVVSTIEAGRALGVKFAAALGCEGNSAACLRAVPVKQLLEHQRGFLPGVMVDGTVLPGQPGALILAGNSVKVPLLSGFTAREQAFALAAREMTQGPLKAEGYAMDISVFVSADRKAEILDAYPISNYVSPSEADIAAIQGSKACISRWLASASAKWAPTYAYEFDDATAPSYFPQMSFQMGAYHTADIQYLFPLFKGGLGTARPLNAVQQKVSEEMISFWVNFARTGDPNGKGLRPWERYNPASDMMLAIGSGKSIPRYGEINRCEFWDGINKY